MIILNSRHPGRSAAKSRDPWSLHHHGPRIALRLSGVTLFWGLLAFPAFANPTPARQEQLRHMVEQDCGSCHGLTRKGGLGSPLEAARLADMGDEALAATILDGRPGTPMPPWRDLLSEDDAAWIVRHLKGEGP